MNKRNMIIAFVIGGFLLCGLLVLLHAVRTAAPDPLQSETEKAASAEMRAVDNWQRNIRLDSRTDYGSALEKLRKEERRQRPEERRN